MQRHLHRIALACLAVLVLAGTPGTSAGQAPATTLTPADIAAGRAYHRLLDAAKSNPAASDWGALRDAYAKSPAFDPLVGGPTPAARDLAQAVRSEQWALAAERAQAAASANWMDLRAHLYGGIANRKLGNMAAAAVHEAAAQGIVREIRASGNGRTKQTAYRALAVSEEYALLNLAGLTFRQQALVQEGGHAYDRMTCVTPEGATVDVFFRIDQLFARETDMVLGKASPVPDNALRP